MSGTPHVADGRIGRLRRYLEHDPANRALREDLFDALLSAGDFDEAAREVLSVLAEQPSDARWRHHHGVLLLATGKFVEAQAILEALRAEGHDDPPIRYNLAYALFGQGKYDAARDVAAPLLDEHADATALAWPLWLRCQHRLEELEAPVRRARDAVTRGELTADALGVASLIAVDAAALEDARAWSRLALRENPEQLEALAASGSLALEDQDAAGAKLLFERALRASADDGRCWLGLALARMMIPDLDGAAGAFRRALTLVPEHAGTWVAWGWCQLFLKRPDGALDAFREALARDEDSGECRGAVALALARLGRVNEAQRELDFAMTLDPDALSVRYAVACLEGKDEDPVTVSRVARQTLTRAPTGSARSA